MFDSQFRKRYTFTRANLAVNALEVSVLTPLRKPSTYPLIPIRARHHSDFRAKLSNGLSSNSISGCEVKVMGESRVEVGFRVFTRVNIRDGRTENTPAWHQNSQPRCALRLIPGYSPT